MVRLAGKKTPLNLKYRVRCDVFSHFLVKPERAEGFNTEL